MGRKAHLLFCTATLWVAAAPTAFVQDQPSEAPPVDAEDDSATDGDPSIGLYRNGAYITGGPAR